MKTHPTVSFFIFLLQITAFASITVTIQSAHAAPTFWTGPNTNYVQPSAGAADVLIKGKVSLARNGTRWLYNTNVDLFGADLGTPSDTEWAFGTLDNYASLSYQSFDSYRNGNLSGVLLGIPPVPGSKPMVVHLINEDIYLSLTWNAWPQHGAGLISYTRSTPGAVVPPTPTVAITNPPDGAVFAAPANVAIAANASVSSGTITNVSFFALGSSTPLGSRQTSPFSIIASNLTASPYSLTAVATAAGVSATSSVVHISVVTPVVISLSGAAEANDKFSFGYSANAGLRYVVESSSNLFNWTPLATNVAAGNPAFFTNDILQDTSFYRVGRLPNP